MQLGDIEIHPIAAESLGVRSFCTRISTPDITILFDPSAALAMRYQLEPHPIEYKELKSRLNQIFAEARRADVLSISHYHYDHVRPGFTNFRYNLSSLEELERMFEGKRVFAKDNREKINPSQRRRGFYFERDISSIVEDLEWADRRNFVFGNTKIHYSDPLPHGPEGTFLGYVLATRIEAGDTTVMFAPDVQGPASYNSLDTLLTQNPDLLILGGPPIYLSQFSAQDRDISLSCLKKLVQEIGVTVIDHHLLRSTDWQSWLSPVYDVAKESGNQVLTMAELKGDSINCLEANRRDLYNTHPPSQDFLDWTNASDEYKMRNLPPIW